MISMTSHFQFSATCLDSARSMDWHSLHYSTTSLTASIMMFGFTFLTRYKVLSFPKWCILCRSLRSSLTQHTRAMSFFYCSQAHFSLISMSTLFFCNGTNLTVIFGPNFLIKSPSGLLISISAASFVLMPLISGHFWLDPWCHCCRICSNFHCL